MTKKMSKKKIIMSVLLAVVILIGAIITILFIKWNNYYNEIWLPLTTIADNTKCDDDPNCWACIYEPEDHSIHKEYSIYYFDLPQKLKYKGVASFSCNPPFDESIKEPQYAVFVNAIIGKDFSDIKWEVCLDTAESLNFYRNSYEAIVNPDTLEVISEKYRESDDIDYMKDCEELIRTGISNMRSIYSPYLG